MCHSTEYEHLQPTTPSKPTRIVVSGQPEPQAWPAPPYDWEMAAVGDALDIVELHRKPSRLERLRRAFRMEP